MVLRSPQFPSFREFLISSLNLKLRRKKNASSHKRHPQAEVEAGDVVEGGLRITVPLTRAKARCHDLL